MPIPLVAGYHAKQIYDDPKGSFMGNNKELIIVLLAGSAVLVFVQHARSGQGQNGTQYIAIGVVGFMLLFLAEFAPEIAFGLAVLFFVGIMLNSPNGVPVIGSATKKGS
jgi:hypothetical protein